MKYKKVTPEMQTYSTFVNVMKVYAMVELMLEKQAEILSKLNATSKEQEQQTIFNELKEKFNSNADYALKQLETN
jgi:hypothetical protein